MRKTLSIAVCACVLWGGCAGGGGVGQGTWDASRDASGDQGSLPDLADAGRDDGGAAEDGGRDAVGPDSAGPDLAEPDSEAPDAVLPDTQTPDTVQSDAVLPDVLVPDSVTPDSQTPDATVVPFTTGSGLKVLDPATMKSAAWRLQIGALTSMSREPMHGRSYRLVPSR